MTDEGHDYIDRLEGPQHDPGCLTCYAQTLGAEATEIVLEFRQWWHAEAERLGLLNGPSRQIAFAAYLTGLESGLRKGAAPFTRIPNDA